MSATTALLSAAPMQSCLARCNSNKQASTETVANDKAAPALLEQPPTETPKISMLSSEMSSLLRLLRQPSQVSETFPAPIQSWLNKNVQGSEAKHILQTIYKDPKGDGRKLIQAMARNGVTVDTGAIDEANVKGTYSPGSNHLRIQSGLAPEEAVLVGIHEGLHGVITPEDGSKQEEALNNVIAEAMSARIFGKQPTQSPDTIIEKTLPLYPDLPESGPYAQPLADIGIDLQDYWPQPAA